MERTDRDVQADMDRIIKQVTADLDAEEAAYAVAVLANRSAAELHRLAKAEAAARRGAADWGNWAAFQNAARNLVLQSSTGRDLAAKLAGRGR